jgi:glycosyltransferase involved in cell wall biosynthesis
MTATQQFPRVSAIVAAYNEQYTIAEVVHRLKHNLLIDEVIVVSDGSTDLTAQVARRAGATVIELRQNVGKGDAMALGVEAAKHDILLFADADLIGLNDMMITMLVKKACLEKYDMFTLIRDRGVEKLQQYIGVEYNIGGERILTRELWDVIPSEDRRGFGVEFALNYYAMQMGLKIGQGLAEGLKQVIKERKRGLVWGFISRVDMFAQCLWTYLKLFIFHHPHVAA